MMLVKLLYAGLQLPDKCMNYVVTGYLTPTVGVNEAVKTDLGGAKHICST